MCNGDRLDLTTLGCRGLSDRDFLGFFLAGARATFALHGRAKRSSCRNAMKRSTVNSRSGRELLGVGRRRGGIECEAF